MTSKIKNIKSIDSYQNIDFIKFVMLIYMPFYQKIYQQKNAQKTSTSYAFPVTSDNKAATSNATDKIK